MTLPLLSLSLQFARLDDAPLHRAALPRHQVRRWIRHALEQDADMTVRIVGGTEGQALNRDYRHQDHPTNVLTFAYGDAPLSADLVLCAPVVARAKPAKTTRTCKPTMRIWWCTAPCTRRAGTMKPALPMPAQWKRGKSPSSKPWVSATPTPDHPPAASLLKKVGMFQRERLRYLQCR